MNIGCSWSGGKDSCFALVQQIKKGDQLKAVLNVMDEELSYSRSHGLRKTILEAQASALNAPIHFAAASWETYEKTFISHLLKLKTAYSIEGMVYGDIDIESHRKWEEKVSNAATLKAYLPLWQKSRKELVYNMIDEGITAIIASCSHELGTDFLGRTINRNLVRELESLGIDACGENGEYHTVVVDCPLFSQPIEIIQKEKIRTNNYCFLEIELKS